MDIRDIVTNDKEKIELYDYLDELYNMGFTVLMHEKPVVNGKVDYEGYLFDRTLPDQRIILITDREISDPDLVHFPEREGYKNTIHIDKNDNIVFINRKLEREQFDNVSDLSLLKTALRMRPDIVRFDNEDGYFEIKNTERDIQASVKAVNPRYRLIEYGPVSSHEEDRHLNSVIANDGNGGYITWIHNAYTGLQLGHYGINDRLKAEKDYYERMREIMRPEYTLCVYEGRYLPETYRRLQIDDILDSMPEESKEIISYYDDPKDAYDEINGYELTSEVEKDEYGRLKVTIYTIEQHEYDLVGDLLSSERIYITPKAEYEDEKLVPMPGIERLKDLKEEYSNVNISQNQGRKIKDKDLDDEI